MPDFVAIFISLALVGCARGAVSAKDRYLRYLCYFVVAMLTAAMFLHLIPNFHNILIFDRVKFAEDSVPFTMYFNIDKCIAGMVLISFFVVPHQAVRIRRNHIPILIKCLAGSALALLPLAYALGYVRFDPKFPDGAWYWMINNLAIVCMAEEGLFRGVIQGGLQRNFPKIDPRVFIGVAALLFGAAHFAGGIPYMALASVAGVFYGYAYWKTSRIEIPMLVHFGTNLIHFLLFSYPALSPS